MLILGIETSCDDTGVGIIGADRTIHANVVASQLAAHQPYGGVVPEIAARAHLDVIDAVITQALRDAGAGFKDLAAIAATTGPGLIGGVMVGAVMGKAIASVRALPFIGVNHLEAHALTARLTDDVAFPYLLLLASGGHCQLLLVRGVGDYRLLGRTIDDAIGECFDKCAKLLGLDYPGGPLIEQAAKSGNPKAFDLPRPLLGRADCDFSFSGLKTAVRLLVQEYNFSTSNNADDPSPPVFGGRGAFPHYQQTQNAERGEVGDTISGFVPPTSPLPTFGFAEASRLPSPPEDGRRGSSQHRHVRQNLSLGQHKASDFIADMAASLQTAIADTVADRARHAFALLKKQNLPVTAFVAAGGVAANQALRVRLTEIATENDVSFVAPPAKLCTDNGVMVAWAGYERLRLGLTDGLDTPARPRWPLEEIAR